MKRVIMHERRDDCCRHVNSKKQKDHGKVQSAHKPIYRENETTNCRNVIHLVSCGTQHSTDDAGHLFRAMFPDSAIAKKYACARTKTSALVQFMSSQTKGENAPVLQISAFSLSTDGSTDKNSVKLYPVVV
ncbi:hypothetical protein PR048_031915 [Dryococelus australis]|uniref:Uncharacterized protein n=1 Tax=Dryococelus australis TaxID=614101 RepID=A0ABQ9G9A6_9NEOP|nr:hypothetical protein PR048_031915 [Dryococelus australis]